MTLLATQAFFANFLACSHFASDFSNTENWNSKYKMAYFLK